MVVYWLWAIDNAARKPGAKKVNLSRVYKLLAAADGQRHGFLKINGRDHDHLVQLMAEAGLVEASVNSAKGQSFTSIDQLTDLGRTFLRAFKDHPSPESAPPSLIKRMASEWNLEP